MTLKSQFLPIDLASNKDLQEIMKDVETIAGFSEDGFVQIISRVNNSVLIFSMEPNPRISWINSETYKIIPTWTAEDLISRLPSYLNIDGCIFKLKYSKSVNCHYWSYEKQTSQKDYDYLSNTLYLTSDESMHKTLYGIILDLRKDGRI